MFLRFSDNFHKQENGFCSTLLLYYFFSQLLYSILKILYNSSINSSPLIPELASNLISELYVFMKIILKKPKNKNRQPSNLLSMRFFIF